MKQTAEQRAKRLAYMKAWREANRARFLAAQKRWRDARLDERRAVSRKYHSEHREQAAAVKRRKLETNGAVVRAQKRAWALAHPDSVKSTNRKQYEKNPDRIKANVRKWITANPARNRLNKNLNYQTRRAAGEVTKAQWAEICLFYGNACALCKNAEKLLTVDHFIPIIKGGTNTPENVWPLCLKCNQIKHTTVPPEGAPPHVAVLQATAVHMQGGSAC